MRATQCSLFVRKGQTTKRQSQLEAIHKIFAKIICLEKRCHIRELRSTVYLVRERSTVQSCAAARAQFLAPSLQLRNSERGLRNDRYLLQDRTAWAGLIKSGAKDAQGTALRHSRPTEHNSSVMTAGTTPAEIVTFWREAGPDKWFEPDREFDLTIRSRFFAVYEAAAGGRLAAWQESREGALALVLLLDQFPRNMFRGEARAFATDATARAVTDGALVRGFDQATDSDDAAVLLFAVHAFRGAGRSGSLHRLI